MSLDILRTGVQAAYSQVAEAPTEEHPFKVGRAFAEGLGYPVEWLNRVPATSVDAFTGVSCVSVFAELPLGAHVLDVGCGAGLDSIIAGLRVGPTGSVLGVDFSEPMLARARASAEEAGLNHVRFEPGEAERLPVAEGSVDVALVNGIFNLNPAREHIMRELARVVKPGGALFCAELILKEPLTSEELANLTNWFS
ncbi:MAG: methyltransferase domain-containing protein [Anaerolineales bacterium]|nr:methyltransferase domain-containing protein [Anaerolineales bacterium]